MSPMAVSHNVMVLNSSTAKLNDFTQPIRMFRDKNSALIQEAPAKAAQQPEGTGRIAVGGGTINAPGSRPTFKKKTKIVFQGDEEEYDEQTRETEAVPWLLEDFDAQHSFVGKLEGGQNSNYVFFVNQGDEFRIIPVNKWYRFQPKLSYHTLTLEEAETQMAARKKDDVSRWLMKNRTQKTSEEDISTISNEAPKKLKLAEKVLNNENEQRRRQVQMVRARIEESRLGEELDFDELFDDDEGNDNFGGLLDDITNEESNELQNSNGTSNSNSSKKSNYKLSSEGRAVKNIVRHLDKSNDIIYASDDENDPYASDYENGEDEDDFDKWSNPNKETAINAAALNKSKTTAAAATTTTNPTTSSTAIAAAAKTSASASSSKASSLSVSPISSRASSPPGSPNKRTAKRSKTSDDEESLIISESEIIGYLKQGPISTKDLIAKFKKQLKADPKNKEIFRELVRKLAMVKPVVGSGEEDKLLELKPEFK